MFKLNGHTKYRADTTPMCFKADSHAAVKRYEYDVR